jgi:hypothetical protein
MDFQTVFFLSSTSLLVHQQIDQGFHLSNTTWIRSDYAIYCKGMQDVEVERISTDICSESIIKYGVGCMDETPTTPSGTATWVIHAGRWC